jgi:SAM-dependent methyltransferase
MENNDSKNAPWRGPAEAIAEILRCTDCQSRIETVSAGMACPNCGRQFPLIGGVLRFVDAQEYAGSFGFQWLKHDRTQLDGALSHRSEIDFMEKTGLGPEDFAGKLVLDVGCGMGRYAEVITRWGAHVVGIDLSRAVEAAKRNLSDRSATIVQADVFKLPIAPESFDLIYSLGVLHHTPNCEEAFKRLPGLLKPGGRIAVWLYSAYNPWYRASDFYRKYTRKMSQKTLHRLCWAAVPIYYVYNGLRRIPLVGRPMSGALRRAFPMSYDADPEWRVLDTFDWYSPYYQSKHTYEQVFRWFESCGLEDLHVANVPVSVRGTKPGTPRRKVEEPLEMVERCAG